MAGKYSEEALMQFMDWVIEKGLLNKQTASSRKTAAQKVLGVLDAAEQEDLREIDPEDAFTRFQNINRSKYTPDSLKVYRSRFTAALDAFLAHADDPSSFKPMSARKQQGTAIATKSVKKSGKKKPSQTSFPGPPQAAPEVPNDGHLTLPIPLRPGLLLKIFGIPADLNEDEAKKICAVVSAYVAHK